MGVERLQNQAEMAAFQARPDVVSPFPSQVPWHDIEAKRKLEEDLRKAGVVGVAKKDGSLEVIPFKEFVPDHVFTAKWNSADIEIPTGTHAGLYQDPLPIDWSLTPNPKDRLSTTDVELHRGIKYAIEGETGIMAIVTEDGLQITHAGPYQDMSDRDVSPAGKTWGNKTIAGMGPLWAEVNDWDELEGAQLNANITGRKAEDVEGDVPHIVTIPADINKLAKHWREGLVKKLQDHPVYKDAKLKPGTRILFTTGLLYWELDYEVRYFNSGVTPDIEMEVTLSLADGREFQSKMKAHTIDKPEKELTEPQSSAVRIWNETSTAGDAHTHTQEVSSDLQTKYQKDRASQQVKGKLERLVTNEGFTVRGNPSREEMQELLPSVDEIRSRYEGIKASWKEGSSIELTLVRSGTSIPESQGELTGVIENTDGTPLDDTLLKRSAQRSYDVGTEMWDKPAPDLIVTAGRTTPTGTMEIAMYGIGEPYPIKDIQRDWRLNERSFGSAIGQKSQDIPEAQLHSFTQAPEGGENYSTVQVKTMSFMMDVMETAQKFTQENGRPMRAVVCAQEGPMQIMRAMLNNESDPMAIFEPIENTEMVKVELDEPFAWPPEYVTEETLREGMATS